MLYWWKDICNFCKSPTLLKAVALCIRFIGFYGNLPLKPLVGFIICFISFSNVLGLLPHAAPVLKEQKKKRKTINKKEADNDDDEQQGSSSTKPDYFLQNIETCADIFPDSAIFTLLAGALNIHCVHHLLPSLPRSLHSAASKEIEALFPKKYRRVDDVQSFLALWLLRAKTFDDDYTMVELVEMAKGNYFCYCIQQVLLDALSLVALWLIFDKTPYHIL